MLIEICDVNNLLLNTKTNFAAYERMLGVIRASRAMAFVGAGVTLNLGYPLWKRLLQELADATVQHCGSTISTDRGPITVAQVMQIPNLLVRADIFRANLGNHYQQILQETFRPRGSNSDMRALVGLPFQHFLTSNYDPALEVAHSDASMKYDSITLLDPSAVSFLHSLNNPGYVRHIVHVHGRFDDPGNIILTTREYDSFYSRYPVVKRFWEIVPVVRQCVFLGFSFSDPELTLKFNLRDLHLAHRDTQFEGHFAVVAISDSGMETALREESIAEWGVDPVFYRPIDEKHSGYSSVIQTIANECGAPAEQAMLSVAALPVEIINPPLQQAGEPAMANLADVSADLQHLERLTTDNLRKRSTGDLP
jgi:SIR2-like domain